MLEGNWRSGIRVNREFDPHPPVSDLVRDTRDRRRNGAVLGPGEAIEAIKKAMRLNPHSPAIYLYILGRDYRLTGRYEEALATLKKALTRDPNFLPTHVDLAGIYSESGREDEARAEAAEVLRINPSFSLEVMKQNSPLKDPTIMEPWLAALRKAGLK